MEIIWRALFLWGFFLLGFIYGAPATKTLSNQADTLGNPYDPCRESLSHLRSNSLDAEPFLRFAACRRLHELDTGLAYRQTRTGSRTSDSILVASLPQDEQWYLNHLVKFKSQRDTSRARNMAYLVDRKPLKNASVYQELAEVYLMLADPLHAIKSYLQVADRDSMQSGEMQYQVESLIRSSASDTPADQLLDSLATLYAPRQAKTAQMLESLCWEHRSYPCAYRTFLFYLTQKNPGPALLLERVNRWQSLGYFDNAAALLDKLAWRTLSQPWLSMARNFYLQICLQLKNWRAIADEFAGSVQIQKMGLSDEEGLILSTAYLKLGEAEKSLNILKQMEEKTTSLPWQFKSRLLKAQVFLALGKIKEATEVLTALKRDPKRLEGTGPILFWQGCLAVNQGHFVSAESLFVLASAYTGGQEAQRSLEYRFFLMQDTGMNRIHFFHGLAESPRTNQNRMEALEQVSQHSALWPFAQLEKAQILVQLGLPDSAEKILDRTAKTSQDRLAGLEAEAKAAFLLEKFSGGRQAALARYEDLLIKYQQGVVPEFSRERIKALK